MIARKMHIGTPTGCLATELTKLEEWVGPSEHKQHTSRIRERFEPIPTPPELFRFPISHQMLCFIEANGKDASFGEGFFNRPTQFRGLIQRFGGYTPAPRGHLFPIEGGSHLSIGHLFNEWFVQCSQDPFIPFAVGERRRCFDENYRQRKPVSRGDYLCTGLHAVSDDAQQL